MTIRKSVTPGQPVDDLQRVKSALDQSERQLQALSMQLEEERERRVAAESVAKVGSWYTDLNTQKIMWSAETYRIFETSPADFDQTHEAFLQHVHPEDRARVDDALMRSFSERTASTVEHRIVLPDGRVKSVEERWLVTHDDQGTPVRAVGTCRDISDQKRAEARIDRLNRVHAVLSGIDHVIVREKDLGALLAAACRIAVDKGHYKVAWIAVPDPSGQLARAAHAAAAGDELEDLERLVENDRGQLHSLARTAFLTGQHHTANDLAHDPRMAGWWAAAVQRGHRAIASLPLITDGVMVGTLNLCADQSHAFDEDEMRLLEGLASEIAFAMDVCRRDAARQLSDASLRASEARLRDANIELHELSTRLNNIREEERARVARDIHDHLGQALTALKMDVAEVRRRIKSGDAAAADERLREMASLIDSSVDDVRRVAAELRPVILDDLGIVLAIQAHLQDVGRRCNLQCVLYTDLTDLPIDSDRATALFRILQEALTNVARHADAEHVVVSLAADAQTVRMSIHDDGRGITVADQRNARGIGLLGMRDRARLFGGTVVITSGPGEGSTVTAELQLAEGSM